MHWATRYIGIPFRHGGRDHNGVDCYGLAYLVLRERFLRKPPIYLEDYPDAKAYREHAARLNEMRVRPPWLEVTAPEPGDVLLFRTAGLPAHCGIAIDATRMLHASAGADSCVEAFRGPRWTPRLTGIYRCVL